MQPLTYLASPSPAPMHEALVETLLAMTQGSTHSYEIAIHRLLLDLIDCYERGLISPSDYGMVMGTATDVLFFFNYNLDLLQDEPNIWYRASVIHQIGHAMLQTLEQVRPDLSAKAFFTEAVSALSLQSAEPRGAKVIPIRCRQWRLRLAGD